MLIGVFLISAAWYVAGGHRTYRGPRNFVGGSADAVLRSGGERPLADLVSDLPTSHKPTMAGDSDDEAEKASLRS